MTPAPADGRVAEAAQAVGSARRRLMARFAAQGAALGLGAGALTGGVVSVIAWWTPFDAGLWPLVPPVLGAVVGAAVFLSRGVASDAAALTLDAAAGTDEAFISAITATGATAEFRALSADYALARCPSSSVASFLPFRAPGIASAALVATALLAALVLVPRFSVVPVPHIDTADDSGIVPFSGASPVGGDGVSPRSRVEQATKQFGDGTEPVSASLAAAVRKDLGAVTNDDLRRLADALATNPTSSDAARRALAALDKGDRAAATEALREALGGSRSVQAADGTGTGTSSVPAPAATKAPWSAPTWPLRYDRVVRRWLDETAAAEARTK